MDSPQSIGERLLLARRRSAMTQQELADRAGVRRLTISRIERGDFFEVPRPGTVRGLAQALGVEPGWILFGDDDAKTPAREFRAGAEMPNRIGTAEGDSIVPEIAA